MFVETMIGPPPCDACNAAPARYAMDLPTPVPPLRPGFRHPQWPRPPTWPWSAARSAPRTTAEPTSAGRPGRISFPLRPGIYHDKSAARSYVAFWYLEPFHQVTRVQTGWNDYLVARPARPPGNGEARQDAHRPSALFAHSLQLRQDGHTHFIQQPVEFQEQIAGYQRVGKRTVRGIVGRVDFLGEARGARMKVLKAGPPVRGRECRIQALLDRRRWHARSRCRILRCAQR